MTMPQSQTNPAGWIWIDLQDRNRQNQYAQFRQEFDLPEAPGAAALRVSVDSNFVAWVNGAFVGCGQFADFPDQRTFSTMEVAAHLKPGKNVLGILVHYCGVDHFSYLPGDAGLWFELEFDGQISLASGERVHCRPSPGYFQDGTARVSAQRGFTFNYDAAHDDDWRSRNYTEDSTWRAAVMIASGPAPKARPVQMLELRPPINASIIAQGLLKRSGAPDRTVAEQMQQDFLSSRRSWELFERFPPNSAPATFPLHLSAARLDGADGIYVVIDLGRIECGFPLLWLNSTGACVIDMSFGEHLDDLRVRSHIGGRNFACRYTARPGVQRFEHYLDRYAARFIELHITQLKQTLELRYAGLIPAEYPVSFAGEFEAADSLANQIWLTCRRTLHLCMHEHYEDCPLREQALYANDSRNQMLCGYYAFGGTEFARASLELLGRSTGPDGFQELCAPMKCPITIPSFTLVWFLAMNDYLMYSGDSEFIEAMLPLTKRMLQRQFEALRDDLLPCPTGERYWHFYDWAPRLDGHEAGKRIVADSMRLEAPLNCFFVLALEAAANMARYAGDSQFADQCQRVAQTLRPAIHRAFWNPQAAAYNTRLDDGPTSTLAELTQALAILAGVGDDTIRGELRRKLMSGSSGMTPTTLSQSLYKFEAILLDESCGRFVRDKIIEDWSRMLFAGATSFWETSAGGWDFNHAASLCHGWSAIPLYFLSAYGLGIRPMDPGFARVAVNPLLEIGNVRGVVTTPRGNLRVEIDRDKSGTIARVQAPAGIEIVASHQIRIETSSAPT
jgi:hypothetical protein